MNVLILGATGYVGTATDDALRARGHQTTGVARSDAAREKLQLRGTSAFMADAAKPNSLDKAVRAADAVVYAVHVTDADAFSVDSAALRAIRKGLAGTEKTFVYVSSAWVYGSTGETAAAEDAPLAPPALVARRLELERATLDMTKIGIRSLVVRPGIVYGRGGGLAAMFVQSACERGSATIVGSGTNRWATIDVNDLGALIASAVECGRPGRAYNAVNDDRFFVADIAAAASRCAGAGGKTTTVDAGLMGQLGECLALDQSISAARAKADLAWVPHAISILADVESGSYHQTQVA
ncbi:MAG: NAD-dependent epimerase/dehydratase family protein [Vulcanimicrobiaceae bacterium]